MRRGLSTMMFNGPARQYPVLCACARSGLSAVKAVASPMSALKPKAKAKQSSQPKQYTAKPTPKSKPRKATAAKSKAKAKASPKGKAAALRRRD